MKRVLVLMSTYNGESYIEEQLSSVVAQKGVEVSILVRDDGSKDSTLHILDRWQSAGALSWYNGRNLGSAGSFMDLVYSAPDADFYAFCDQDDVWFSDKLQRAVTAIDNCGEADDVPVLYFSAQLLTDEKLQVTGRNIPKRLFTFGESLLRNPAAGCTMVFNKKMRDLVAREKPSTVYMHDMWVYMLCKAVGGVVLFDSTPSMYYRQHGDNVVGYSPKLLPTIKRRAIAFFCEKGQVRKRACEELLRCYSRDIPTSNKKLLETVVAYQSSFYAKLKAAFLPELTSVEWWTRIAVVMSFFANRY